MLPVEIMIPGLLLMKATLTTVRMQYIHFPLLVSTIVDTS